MKYNLEFKLSLVRQVLKTQDSLRSIAKQNKLPHSILQLWVNFYNTYGIQGLQLPSKKYDDSFKLHVIKTLQQEKLSLSEACIRFEIPSKSTLWKWLKKYEDQGIEALFKEPM